MFSPYTYFLPLFLNTQLCTLKPYWKRLPNSTEFKWISNYHPWFLRTNPSVLMSDTQKCCSNLKSHLVLVQISSNFPDWYPTIGDDPPGHRNTGSSNSSMFNSSLHKSALPCNGHNQSLHLTNFLKVTYTKGSKTQLPCCIAHSLASELLCSRIGRNTCSSQHTTQLMKLVNCFNNI